MASLCIAEFTTNPLHGMPHAPPYRVSYVPIEDKSNFSEKLGPSTCMIRLQCGVPCAVKFTTGAEKATLGDMRVQGTEYWGVSPEQRYALAVIAST
jgi:hypothetical protein